MVFPYIPFAVAFVGSTLAALYDLKTTEIPDKFPYSMITIAIIYYLFLSIVQDNFFYIVNSLLVGLSFLAFGFLMYYLGQWGGGDAKLLSAIGFLLPSRPEFATQTVFPFPMSFFINVFLVGAAYMIVYALIYSILNKKIIFYFVKEIKASSKFFFITLTSFSITILIFSYYFSAFVLGELAIEFIIKSFILVFTSSFLLLIIWKFVKVVEKFGFVKKIPVSKLKVGDVLASSRYIEGITQRELRKIRKSKLKFVKIKEGVRFGLAFPLALLATIYYGDIIFYFRVFF